MITRRSDINICEIADVEAKLVSLRCNYEGLSEWRRKLLDDVTKKYLACYKMIKVLLPSISGSQVRILEDDNDLVIDLEDVAGAVACWSKDEPYIPDESFDCQPTDITQQLIDDSNEFTNVAYSLER